MQLSNKTLERLHGYRLHCSSVHHRRKVHLLADDATNKSYKTYLQTGFDSSAVTFQENGGGEKLSSCSWTQGHSLGIWLAALARRTAPGLGYGLCWNRGPAAVVSAPVFASLRLGSPLDHEPLLTQCLSATHSDVLGVYKTLNHGPETSGFI